MFKNKTNWLSGNNYRVTSLSQGQQTAWNQQDNSNMTNLNKSYM